MNWTEQKTDTRRAVEVTEAKAKLFEEVKKELPVVQKEAAGGVRPFQAVEFQPVKAIGLFEAEFGVKGDDVLFHIWPWGYHDHDRYNEGVDSSLRKRPPSFYDNFERILKSAMGRAFGEGRCDFSFDGDVGAWFVKAKGFASNQFHRKICIEAAKNLYKDMGGKD